MSHFKSFINVFDDEIKSVKNVISNFSQDNINKIIDEILHNSGRLIVSGIGKSGLIGKKLQQHLQVLALEVFLFILLKHITVI